MEKKKKSKKWLWIVVIVLLLLGMRSCTNKVRRALSPKSTKATTAQTEKATLATTAAAAQPTVQETAAETTQPAKTADYYYGTWSVYGIEEGGAVLLLEDLIQSGRASEDIRNYRLILQSTGECGMISTGSFTGKWETTDTGVLVDNTLVTLNDNMLVFEFKDKGFNMLFQKISSSEEIPETQPEETTAPETTAPETTAAASGLRPEFKEAMDAYEAFYDEYCEFYKEYKANPTNLGLLSKYAGMLTKAEEMDKKFESWDESNMTNEELKYYLEVSTRIQQKMIDLF